MKCHNKPQIAPLFSRSVQRRRKSNSVFSFNETRSPRCSKASCSANCMTLRTHKKTHIYTHILTRSQIYMSSRTHTHTRRHTFRCLLVFCHEVVIQFVLTPSPWLYFLWVMFPQGIVNGSISENTKYRKQQRFQEMGMIQSELMEGLRHHMF